MKVAIVGTRTLTVGNLEKYLPEGVTEIISGGAKGIDTCAREYAIQNGLKLTEYLPNYKRYGKGATHVRNADIVENSEIVLAFWDGRSRGTLETIKMCRAKGRECRIYLLTGDGYLRFDDTVPDITNFEKALCDAALERLKSGKLKI